KVHNGADTTAPLAEQAEIEVVELDHPCGLGPAEKIDASAATLARLRAPEAVDARYHTHVVGGTDPKHHALVRSYRACDGVGDYRDASPCRSKAAVGDSRRAEGCLSI